MRKRTQKNVAEDEKAQDLSRRGFMKQAALGTGVAAAVGVKSAQAAVDTAPFDIHPPEDVGLISKTPIPDIDFPMRGADVFARVCKAEGLAALFCCPGNYQVITAIANQGIPIYGGRTEGPMCSAADAFTRVTGEISASSGTEGPGFTNMICAIAAANAARTPLLVLASNMSMAGDDTESRIQRGYQQPTTEGLKKYGKRLVDPARVHEYAAYAFRQLRSGVPKPVHLDFTVEVSSAEIKSAADLSYYFDSSKYRTDSKPHPDPKDIVKAVKMIAASKRPMIVSSTGVFYGKAWEALQRLAEKNQIPVVESGPTRGQFSDGHPLSASTAPNALPSADLVILVGQYCMPTIGEYAFGPDTVYIRIDPGQEDIGRNIPIDLGIVSDEKAALEALHAAVPVAQRKAWVAEIATARAIFEEENEKLYTQGAAYKDAVHPAVMAKHLGDFLYRGNIPKEQTTVVAGGFGIARYMRRFLRAYRPGQICNGAYQYGSIGPDVGYTFGAGVAVQLGAGVQAAYKGHPVVGITGDAGYAYSCMEVETMCMYGIPAIIIVYNNNSWGTWPGNRRSKLVSHVHLFQENLRYDKLAEALGAHGEYVTTPGEFTPALERCWEVAVKESRPSVINCQAKKEFGIRSEYPPGFLGKVEPGCMAYNH